MSDIQHQEIRFAVVMYGGVSLAIYMNGISQELLHLVRATDGYQPPPAGAPERSRDVYRELAYQLRYGQAVNSSNVRADAKQDEPPTRFVVDILSGTSAGGINAVFLAKALAQGTDDLEALQALWRQKGDIDTLLNDQASIKDGHKRYPTGREKTSVLNSRRMYGMLNDAFDAMGQAKRTDASGPRRLDLYVTATDLYGVQAPIQLADGVVDERLHKHVFHFVHEADHSQFRDSFNPMLAFASRCTSSFPVAFEPMTLDHAFSTLSGLDKERFNRDMAGFFRYAFGQGDLNQRPYADGGYLDLKPFGHAIEALGFRNADCPVDRKLLFINPFAASHQENMVPDMEEIDFVKNATMALTSLPRYETIREDIERLNRRNRWLRRVNILIEEIEAKVLHDQQLRDNLSTAPQRLTDIVEKRLGVSVDIAYPHAWLDEVIRVYDSSYAAYHHAKVYAVSDFLAEAVTRAAGLEVKSDLYRAIRFLVQAWRKRNYAPYATKAGEEKASETKFLANFDLDFRIRRLGYLQRALQAWFASKDVVSLKNVRLGKQNQDAANEYLTLIRNQLRLLLNLRESLLRRGASNPLSNALTVGSLAEHLTPDRLRDVIDDSDYNTCFEKAEALLDELGIDRFQNVANCIHEVIRGTNAEPGTQAVSVAVGAILGVGYDEAKQIKPDNSSIFAQMRWLYYWGFDYRDSLVFPLIASGDYGEGEEVEIFRISPVDARNMRSAGMCQQGPKLAGTRLFAFGGFLNLAWRENDILWGRLDGAERLIKSLLPRPKQAKLRNVYIRRAQAAILREVFEPLHGRSPLPTLYNLKLASAGKDRDAVDYFENHYNLNTQLDNRQALSRISRTARVASSMFGKLSSASQPPTAKMHNKLSGWLGRLGKAAAGMVEFSLPTTTAALLLHHWLRLMILAAVVLVTAGLLLKQTSFAAVGGTLVVLVALLFGNHWLLCQWLGKKAMRGKGIWCLKALTFAVILVFVGIWFLGVYTALYRWDTVLAWLPTSTP